MRVVDFKVTNLWKLRVANVMSQNVHNIAKYLRLTYLICKRFQVDQVTSLAVYCSPSLRRKAGYCSMKHQSVLFVKFQCCRTLAKKWAWGEVTDWLEIIHWSLWHVTCFMPDSAEFIGVRADASHEWFLIRRITPNRDTNFRKSRFCSFEGK